MLNFWYEKPYVSKNLDLFSKRWVTPVCFSACQLSQKTIISVRWQHDQPNNANGGALNHI